jgi:hypothetical protein
LGETFFGPVMPPFGAMYSNDISGTYDTALSYEVLTCNTGVVTTTQAPTTTTQITTTKAPTTTSQMTTTVPTPLTCCK